MNMIPIRSIVPGAVAPRPVAVSDLRAVPAFTGFRRLRGASGRSYLVSVHAIGACPDYVDAVLVAIGEGENGVPSIIWLGDTAAGGAALRATLNAAAEAGAREAHVHLLAGDAAARLAVIRDLDARH